MLTKTSYQNKEALIVTKHGKERVISPILSKYLGLEPTMSEGFDTDQFGTFSGSIQRKEGPKKTVRKKCLHALEYFSKPIGLATEGSFGYHPANPFIPAHEEWVVFMDLENGLEIYERHLTTSTVQFSKSFHAPADAIAFLKTIGLPDQRIFVHKEEKVDEQAKYPASLSEAIVEVVNMLLQQGVCWITSDLRAHANPSRMKVIEEVTEKLMKRLFTHCPKCSKPGYGIVDLKRGLPCAQCNVPSVGVIADIFECHGCGFSEEKNQSNYPKYQDPMYCLICNP
jgi:hypothetical protein